MPDQPQYELLTNASPDREKIENESDLALGQWYWLKWKAAESEDDTDEEADDDE